MRTWFSDLKDKYPFGKQVYRYYLCSMKIKIIECKGSDVTTYKDEVECDGYVVFNRHIQITKNGIQLFHLPARYFGIEVLQV